MQREQFVDCLRNLGWSHFKLKKVGFVWAVEIKNPAGTIRYFSSPYLTTLFKESILALSNS